MTNYRFNSGINMLSLIFALLLTATSCKKTISEEITSPLENPKEQSTSPKSNGREYTLVPDNEVRLVVDNKAGKYKPGDILNLKGNFSAVIFTNMSGTSGSPIIVRNAPNTVLKIGNPGWNGGAWSTALGFRNCHHIKVAGTSRSNFIINGSTQPNRPAYFNLTVAALSDNFEISNITINNGGTGIWAKTEPTADPKTHYPNYYMENLLIHDVAITGTNNEAMYIGHTANYWSLAANTSIVTLPAGATLGPVYIQPIKWRNVKIYNNVIKNTGADGMQTAAIDKLEIYNNDISNWGMQHNPSHSGGLLVGGRVTSSYIHDNIVHNGWGEIFQFFGSGENGVPHVVKNNLFRDNFTFDGVSFRGTNNAVVKFTHNTIARTMGVSLRINGHLGMKSKQIIEANAFIEPRRGGGTVDARAYIYLENGAAAEEGTGTNANTKFPTVATAKVDVNNFYLPKAGSGLQNSGFRK